MPPSWLLFLLAWVFGPLLLLVLLDLRHRWEREVRS